MRDYPVLNVDGDSTNSPDNTTLPQETSSNETTDAAG